MSYINAALLADEPMTIEAGNHIELRYRLIVHDGRWDASFLQKAYARFARAEDVPHTK